MQRDQRRSMGLTVQEGLYVFAYAGWAKKISYCILSTSWLYIDQFSNFLQADSVKKFATQWHTCRAHLLCHYPYLVYRANERKAKLKCINIHVLQLLQFCRLVHILYVTQGVVAYMYDLSQATVLQQVEPVEIGLRLQSAKKRQ